MIKYITAHRILFLWYILFSVLRVALGLLLPFVLSGIINSAVDRDLELLGRLLFGGIGLVAVSVGVSYLWGLICNKMKRMARDSVKRDLFRSVMDKNVLAFESKENAEYLSVFLQNLDVLETLYFDNLLQIPTTLLAFLAAVVTSVILEPLMLIVIVLLGTMTSVVVKAMAKKLEVATNHYTKSLSEYTGWISNALQCFRLIRTYAIADKMEEKHGEQSLSVEIAKQKSLDKRLAFQRINEFAGVTTTLIIMGVAAYFAISGSFSTGIVLAFGQIAGNIIGPIMSGSDILVSVKSAKSLEKKYTDFLSDSSRTEVEDSGTNRERKIAKSGDIRVEKLGFSYGDRKIFEGLSCTFRENRRHLIVGGNGSGKSTLLMLLMGQYGADGDLHFSQIARRDSGKVRFRFGIESRLSLKWTNTIPTPSLQRV